MCRTTTTTISTLLLPPRASRVRRALSPRRQNQRKLLLPKRPSQRRQSPRRKPKSRSQKSCPNAHIVLELDRTFVTNARAEPDPSATTAKRRVDEELVPGAKEKERDKMCVLLFVREICSGRGIRRSTKNLRSFMNSKSQRRNSSIVLTILDPIMIPKNEVANCTVQTSNKRASLSREIPLIQTIVCPAIQTMTDFKKAGNKTRR